MLSERIREMIKTVEVCKNDTADFKPGTEFDELTVADPRGNEVLRFGAVIFLGFISDGEMLVRSADGREYMTLRDGTGAENGRLYAISAGWAQRFKAPLSAEEMRRILKTPETKRGVYARLAERAKRDRIQTILKVLKENPL